MHILYPNKLQHCSYCDVYHLYLCSIIIDYNLTYQYTRLLKRYIDEVSLLWNVIKKYINEMTSITLMNVNRYVVAFTIILSL